MNTNRGATNTNESRRARVAKALDWLGILDRLLWLRGRLNRRSLAAFTYHRVGHPRDAGELDSHLFEVGPSDLEDQLDVIKANATIVSISDLARFRGGKPLPPNPVLITFDDGYVDNHEFAAPILRRAGVQATFFIATAFPDSGHIFWWDRVALIMKRCTKEFVTITYPALLSVEPRRDPGAAANRICRAVKRTSAPDLPRLWEELERVTGVVFTEEEEKSIAMRTIMSWKQIQSLSEGGLDVQSHSHEHLLLNTLEPAAVKRDLDQSVNVLRETIGHEVHSVAYPVGHVLEGAERRAPAEAQFKLGFTNDTGLCKLDEFDPLNVPRVSMDLEDSGAMHKLLLLEGGELRRKAFAFATSAFSRSSD